MEDPYTSPALEPPPGVTPNFIDPVTTQPTLVKLTIVCLVISILAITARTYVRLGIMKTFDVTDGCLILGASGFIGFTAIQIVAGQYGQGRHQWDVTQYNMSKILLMLNVIEILYGPSMGPLKYVVLRQIDGIFFSNNTSKSFGMMAVKALIWGNIAFYSAITVAFLCACVPREKIWNPTGVEGVCIDTHASIIATSAINVASDLLILLIPIVGIFKLQLPLKKQIGAAAVFAVGIFSIVTSIIRLYYSVVLTQTDDVTWAITPVACWALGEFTTVILVACFPLFPRLVKHWQKKDLSSTQGYHVSSNSTSRGTRGTQVKPHTYENSSTVALAKPSDESFETDAVALGSMGAKRGMSSNVSGSHHV